MGIHYALICMVLLHLVPGKQIRGQDLVFPLWVEGSSSSFQYQKRFCLYFNLLQISLTMIGNGLWSITAEDRPWPIWPRFCFLPASNSAALGECVKFPQCPQLFKGWGGGRFLSNTMQIVCTLRVDLLLLLSVLLTTDIIASYQES